MSFGVLFLYIVIIKYTYGYILGIKKKTHYVRLITLSIFRINELLYLLLNNIDPDEVKGVRKRSYVNIVYIYISIYIM